MLDFLFNSEYCEIFKSTYFEERLRVAACENVFMKLRKIEITDMYKSYRNTELPDEKNSI